VTTGVKEWVKLYLHSPVRLHGVVLGLKKNITVYCVPIRAAYLVHCELFDVIILTTVGELHKSKSYILWTILHSPSNSPFLGAGTFLSTLFSLKIFPWICFSFEHDSGGHEYHIYTGMINIPLSSSLVAVSIVSKNMPHTVEVILFINIYVVLVYSVDKVVQ